MPRSILDKSFNWPDRDHWQALSAFIRKECPATAAPVSVAAVFTVTPQGTGTWHLARPDVLTLANGLLMAISGSGVCNACQVQVVNVTKVAPVRIGHPPRVWIGITELSRP